MTVELRVNCAFDDENNQSIDVTVNEQDTGDSETQSIVDGDNVYELNNITGDIDYSYTVDVDISSNDIATTPSVQDIEVRVPGEYTGSKQERITSEAEWSAEAIDNSEAVVDARPYIAKATTDDGITAVFRPLSLNYSPAINSAKNASFEVEPEEWWEDSRFRGADVIIMSRGNLIYSGIIEKIDYEQPAESYSIDTRSEGKKLRDESIDITENRQLVSNSLARVIDEYNDVDGGFDRLRKTDQETLTQTTSNIENSIVVADGNTSGSVTYTNVGREAVNVSVIYARVYAPGNGVVAKIDDGETVYSETLEYDDTEFGSWFSIKPDGLADTYYDVTFELNDSEAKVHDWRAIKNIDIWRDIQNCSCRDAGYEDTLYTYNSDSNDGIPEGNPSMRVTETTDGYQARQKCLWNVIDSSSDGAQSVSGNATHGHAITTADENYRYLPAFDKSGVSLPAWEVWARVALHNDNGSGTCGYEIEFVSTNERISGDIDTSTLDEDTYEWVKLADYTQNRDIHYDFAYTGNGNDRPGIKGTDTGDDDVWFSDFVVIIGEDADVNYEYEFAEELTNGHLNSPQLYDSGYVQFEEVDVPNNILRAEATATISNQTDVQGDWGVVQTTEPNSWDFDELPNSDTSRNLIVASEQNHISRVYLEGAGERDTATPRLGYKSQEVTEITVDAIHSDMYVIYDKDIQDNILSAANGLVSDTRYLFRFEGDTLVAFPWRARMTDKDVISDSITSSQSIEDVYASAEVIGADGVTSGRIEAKNPPEGVNRHKELRDETVTNRSQAISQCKEFLRENSIIQYSGSLDTYATFVPLGEEMPGHYFKHGEPMTIESVSYGMDSSSVTLGDEDDIAQELIGLNTSLGSTKQSTTSE